jgi:tetratricopeptide (TPR) repeat protein
MKTQEWFRRQTWTAADEAEFERKLARARGQRSQYLHIQALTLAETEDPALANQAIALANRQLQEDPDGIFRAQVLCTIARASATKGDVAGAVDAYRRAVKAEQEPGLRCCAYLQLAWFAVNHELSELYEEVLSMMDSSMKDGDLVFPAAQYKYFGALALISEALGDSGNAARMARNALNAAMKQRSPFDRHPAVGLVGNTDTAVHRKIERLAG